MALYNKQTPTILVRVTTYPGPLELPLNKFIQPIDLFFRNANINTTCLYTIKNSSTYIILIVLKQINLKLFLN